VEKSDIKYVVFLMAVISTAVIILLKRGHRPVCNGQRYAVSQANAEGDMETPITMTVVGGIIYFEPNEAGTYCIEIKKEDGLSN
jgi:hypothetical protein